MLATDREQILKALFSGYGTLGNDHPIPPTDPYFNKELPQRKYDPDKAAFHFKKAGISDPKILLQASDAAFNGAVDMAHALAGERGEGRHQGRRQEGAGRRLLGQRLAEGRLRQQLLGRPAGGDADALGRLQAGAPWNETHWNNEQVREAARRRAGGTDEAKRKPYIWEMQAMLNERGGAIIPVFRDWLDAHNRQGRRPHAAWRLRHGQRLDPGEGLAQVVIDTTARAIARRSGAGPRGARLCRS